MKYQIVGEAHEGAFSVSEECFAIVEAKNEIDALMEYAKLNAQVNRDGDTFRIGARRLSAVVY